MSETDGVPSCVNCRAPRTETELFENGDGETMKRCVSCGHEWGPFVGDVDVDPPEEEQTGLGDFV